MSANLAQIQSTAHAGRHEEAQAMLRGFLSELFLLDIASVEIRKDSLSLNSVNGFVRLASPDPKSKADLLFFKFHHEENEEGIKEYYNSALLAENGFPVEMPVYASHEVGRQVLIYPYKNSERMADICKRLDRESHETPGMRSLLAAQEALDELTATRYLATLHEAKVSDLEDEPLLQLFHHRLTDDPKAKNPTLGGRFGQFYAGKVFELPGRSAVVYDDLARLRWRINGLDYDATLGEIFKRALHTLSPAAHPNPYPAVVAHGDAHNGNVWYNAGARPFLSFFDPAFAGPHIPALLAEIKPAFHNIFAHPLWLYDSREADKTFEIGFSIHGGCIEVEHDWKLSLLRKAFLETKTKKLLKPLLRELKTKKTLPENWQDYMRLALFCCPTLVMNLRAGAGNASNSHTPKTSLLGLCVAMMLASPPVKGHDAVSEFFAELDA